MAYVPGEPANLESIEQVRSWVLEELRSISKELNETTSLELRTRFVEPKRPRDGMIVSADGVSWNPGAGAGIYGRVAGAWVKL